MKLFQLQLFDRSTSETVFGRLRRSKSAVDGGKIAFFLGPVLGRERFVDAVVGRLNDACSRRFDSWIQGTQLVNCRLSRRWANDCSLFTRKMCGASKTNSRPFFGFCFSSMARFVAVLDMIKSKRRKDHLKNVMKSFTDSRRLIVNERFCEQPRGWKMRVELFFTDVSHHRRVFQSEENRSDVVVAWRFIIYTFLTPDVNKKRTKIKSIRIFLLIVPTSMRQELWRNARRPLIRWVSVDEWPTSTLRRRSMENIWPMIAWNVHRSNQLNQNEKNRKVNVNLTRFFLTWSSFSGWTVRKRIFRREKTSRKFLVICTQRFSKMFVNRWFGRCFRIWNRRTRRKIISFLLKDFCNSFLFYFRHWNKKIFLVVPTLFDIDQETVEQEFFVPSNNHKATVEGNCFDPNYSYLLINTHVVDEVIRYAVKQEALEP